jgi:hypothetical protein
VRLLARLRFWGRRGVADDPQLIWDYKNGFIVNTSTGEVVDQIYVLSESSGFNVRDYGRLHEFEHYYPLLGKPVHLSKGLRRVYRYAKEFIEDMGIHVDPLLLIRIILTAHEHSKYINDLLPAVIHTYLRTSNKFIGISEICKHFNIDSDTCSHARNIVLKLTSTYKYDRKSTIVQLIDRYSNHIVSSVAKILLPHAKIDGIASKCVVASLIWLSSQIVGEEASQKSIANLYNMHPFYIPVTVTKMLNNVKIVKTKAGVVAEIVLPKKICEEISKIAQLSPKVTCVG